MKLRLLPLLLFIGAVGILWLLSARRADGAEGPWSVVKSRIEPSRWCGDSQSIDEHGNLKSDCFPEYVVYIASPIDPTHLYFKDRSMAQDFVDAMNEAHERRHQHKINVTCKEISHTFMDCENIESDDHGSGLRPEK